MSVSLPGQAVAKHRGGHTGDRLAETFTARSAPHIFAAGGAGIGEVKIFGGNGVDTAPPGEAEELGNRMPDLGIAAGGRP